MNKITQAERIIAYMRMNGSISQGEAIDDLGCTRLSARIADLEKAGYTFTKKTVKCKNRFGDNTHYTRYYLEAEA